MSVKVTFDKEESMFRFNTHALRTRITLVTFGIFLLGTWSLTLYFARVLEKDIVRTLSEQQYSMATLLSKDIDHQLNQRLEAIQLAAAASESAMLQGAQATQAFIDERPIMQTLFNGGIVAVGKDGTAIANFPPDTGRIGLNYMDIPVVAAALQQGVASIGNPTIGRKLRTPVFGIAAPIRDAQGTIIGAMAGVIDLGRPSFLSDMMASRFGESGGYLLIDRLNRMVVTATDKRRIMEQLPAAGINPVIDRFLAGAEGSAILINPLGQEMLVSDRGLQSVDWLFSVVMPTSEVFAPAHDMRRRMLLAALLLTCAAAALAWWAVRRQFAAFEDTVHRLGKMREPGHPLIPLPVPSQDEIGELITSFNGLIETLEQREAALRESDNCLQSILATSLDGFWRVSFDGHLLAVNETYARLSGYRVEELIGCHISQLLADGDPQITNERHRRIIELGGAQFEDTHRRRDGSLWHVEASVSYRPANGGEVIAFIRDISGRKHAEAALREAEHKFNALVQQSLIGVYIIRDTRWLYVNQHMASMFGYSSPDEVVAEAEVMDLVTLPDRERVASNIRRRLNGDIDQLHYQFTALRKDGSTFDIEVHGSGIDFEGGRAVVGIALDITARRAAERELEQHRASLEKLVLERTRELAEARDRAESANRAKTAFLGNMSHELRTPLHHIAGFAALLEREIASPSGKDRLAKLKGATTAITALINELLDYSSLEAGQIVIEETNLELGKLFEQVAAAHHDVATSKGVTLDFEIGPELPSTVCGDALRLAQILGHLVSNAIKFSEHGSVTVRAMRHVAGLATPTLRFEVADTGIGIPPELHAGLFHLFNQGDGSTTRRFGGTGLGLALCKRLVGLMAGDIGFSSSAGQGSTFWFTVPLILPAGQRDEEAANTQARLPGGQAEIGQTLEIS